MIENGRIAGNRMLLSVWSWLEESRKIVKENGYRMPDGSSFKYQGILSIINSSLKKSIIENKYWQLDQNSSKNSYAKTFK